MKSTGPLLLAVVMLSVSALAQAGRRTSLEDAVSDARNRYPGRVLSAETDRRGGRESYNIRILTNDGRVKRLRVDPESGDAPRRKQR